MPSPLFLIIQLLSVFRRTFTYILFKLFMEIVYVFVAHQFRNFVNLMLILYQQFNGMPDTHLVHIGIKAFPQRYDGRERARKR